MKKTLLKTVFGFLSFVAMANPAICKGAYEWPDYDFSKDDVITIQPEGELKIYEREGKNLKAYLGGVEEGIQQGLQIKVVFGEDGKTVWLYNVISTAQDCLSWVKGELDGNKITIPESSLLWYGDYGTYGLCYILCNLQYNSAGEGYESYECIPGDIEFSIENDIITLLPNSSGEAAIGLQRFADDDFYWEYDYNYKWLGYGDLNSVYRPFDEIPQSGPTEGTNIEQYAFTYSFIPEEGVTGHLVDVAFENDKIWIRGISKNLAEDAWIYADLVGNQAILPQSQYLGVYKIGYDQCLIYLCSGEMELRGEEYYLGFADNTVFNIDRENGKLISDGTLIYNRGIGEVLYSEYYTTLGFAKYIEEAVTPADPEIGLDYYYDEDWEMAQILVEIPCFGTEGNFIDPSFLSFRVFVDGSPFTFDPSVYFGLFEPMTEIPYDFSDGWDIYSLSPGVWQIQFYGVEPESIGVQSISRAGGEIRESNIVTFLTSQIEEIEKTDEIKETRWFNLNGIEVSQENKGLLIKMDIMTDGRVKTSKVIKK